MTAATAFQGMLTEEIAHLMRQDGGRVVVFPIGWVRKPGRRTHSDASLDGTKA